MLYVIEMKLTLQAAEHDDVLRKEDVDTVIEALRLAGFVANGKIDLCELEEDIHTEFYVMNNGLLPKSRKSADGSSWSLN
jgi:hypothetical protein